ncbi:hypothetical protein JW698_00585 [Candidatus Wolfebacteria bacterium]|nr:hypothetical protein [Candidatus Wolfebacteria bacterium]
MKNIESKIFEKVDMNKTYEKAKNLLQEEEIKLDDFTDLYGEENIKKDKKYVEEMEKKFIQQSSPECVQAKELATILEAIIYDQTELSNWFGETAVTIKTSRYDDIVNKADIITEFQESAFAIDATLSSDIEKKFNCIKKEIEKNKLSRIKYFISDRMNIREELRKIPRFIIGVDCKIVKELSELWINRENKALEKHPIQFLILKEIILQCEAFKNFAEKINQPEIAAIYEKSQRVIEKIYNDKKISEIEETESYDNVLQVIKMNLKNF